MAMLGLFMRLSGKGLLGFFRNYLYFFMTFFPPTM